MPAHFQMIKTIGPDFISVAAMAHNLKVSVADLNWYCGLVRIPIEGGRIETSRFSNSTQVSAMQLAVRKRNRLSRSAVAPAQPLNDRLYKRADWVAAKCGIMVDLVLEVAGENNILIPDPTGRSDEPLIIWQQFDAVWRDEAERAKIRRRNTIMLASNSADRARSVAKSQTKQEMLDAAAAAERRRCREARGDYSGE